MVIMNIERNYKVYKFNKYNQLLNQLNIYLKKILKL